MAAAAAAAAGPPDPLGGVVGVGVGGAAQPQRGASAAEKRCRKGVGAANGTAKRGRGKTTASESDESDGREKQGKKKRRPGREMMDISPCRAASFPIHHELSPDINLPVVPNTSGNSI